MVYRPSGHERVGGGSFELIVRPSYVKADPSSVFSPDMLSTRASRMPPMYPVAPFAQGLRVLLADASGMPPEFPGTSRDVLDTLTQWRARAPI